MKPTVIALMAVFVLMPLISKAGISKGHYIIGGNFFFETESFFSDDFAGTSSQRALLNPVYGYFFSDNLVAGPSFLWSYTLREGFPEPETLFQFGPFFRFYTGINLFVEASVKYDRFKNESIGVEHRLFTGSALGFSIKLSENLLLEPRGYLDFGLGDPMLVYSGFTLGIVGLLEHVSEAAVEE